MAKSIVYNFKYNLLKMFYIILKKNGIQIGSGSNQGRILESDFFVVYPIDITYSQDPNVATIHTSSVHTSSESLCNSSTYKEYPVFYMGDVNRINEYEVEFKSDQDQEITIKDWVFSCEQSKWRNDTNNSMYLYNGRCENISGAESQKIILNPIITKREKNRPGYLDTLQCRNTGDMRPWRNCSTPAPGDPGAGYLTKPIKYRLTINFFVEGMPEEQTEIYTILQSKKAILYQEYIDFRYQPPRYEEIKNSSDVATSLGLNVREMSKNLDFHLPLRRENGQMTNENGLIIDKGMSGIFVKFREKFREKFHEEFPSSGSNVVMLPEISLNSAFRTPRRNAAVNGVYKSLHLCGGAVDVSITGESDIRRRANYLFILYKSAYAIKRADAGSNNANRVKNIFLENQSTILFHGTEDHSNLNIDSSLSVGADKIVRRIKRDCITYITENYSNYRGLEINNSDVTIKANLNIPLECFFVLATHVHVDNRFLIESLTRVEFPSLPPDSPSLPPDSPSLPPDNNRWGDLQNAENMWRKIASIASNASNELIDIYIKIEGYALTIEENIISPLIKDLSIQRKETWKERPWPDILRCNFDWDYTDIVIHHSAYDLESDAEKLEKIHNYKYNYPDIGYHFLINEKGTIFEGRSLLFRGDHLDGAEKNIKKIGIVILGNSIADDVCSLFPEPQEIPLVQIESLRNLILKIRQKIQTATTLGGHREYMLLSDVLFESFSCPGDQLTKEISKFIEANKALGFKPPKRLTN